MGWQDRSFGGRIGKRYLRQNGLEPCRDLSRFFHESKFVQFIDRSRPKLMQALELPALSEQFKPVFERGNPQRGCPGKDSRPPGLQVKERSAWSTAPFSDAGDLLKEFGGASVFTFGEGEIRLLQYWRHLLRECFSDLTTEHAAH